MSDDAGLRKAAELEGAEALLRAIQLSPSDPALYDNLGNILGSKGLADAAAACHLHASTLFRDSRRPQQAIEAARRAGRLRPNAQARLELGLGLFRAKQYDKAQPLLDGLARDLAELAAVARFMSEGRDVAEVRIGGETLRFRITPAANIGIAMAHINGRLYEQAELDYCLAEVPQGASVVDVGANVGNHLLYFAKLLKASRIVPVEPHPDAVKLLRENIALNALTCVDASCLGLGAGEARARGSMRDGIDLAQADLQPDAKGAIEIAPLDALITGAVDFIKIDVEGAEVGVLKGARGLVGRCRPLMLVEVAAPNRARFDALLLELGYSLRKEFRHGGYSNCFVAPAR